MACECWKQANAQLAERNTRLVRSLRYAWRERKAGRSCEIVFGGLILETEKIDPTKRGKPVPVVATYCPLCGVKYAGEGADES